MAARPPFSSSTHQIGTPAFPYFTDQGRRVELWTNHPRKIKNRMSSFLEPGQTATGTNEEEVRRTESQLGKDLLGEEREKKEQRENYDPPPPQHHTWCYLTSTQLQDYNKRFEESGGYDVGDVPYDAVDIPIKPVCLDSPKLLERMEKYSNLALEEHNRHNDTKYEFVKVLKATFSTGGARRYFITFQVKDITGPGSPTLNSFRARVYDGFKSETIVEFCAPEP
ncbi:hypothetical protein RHMOL_Rhmol04G0363900 [Rhododendron molle]|uniref:Uncharacterized protein n=1 Tax=Rhododendron molle TaxID=49168 RepID=A0ACC0P948_RHOML|nr:hypothetical protein RHMOL_Rhmol04G0363900 [Rhododendron molle]